jgi:hypothetical protein
MSNQLAQQGWDDAPPGVAIAGPGKTTTPKPQAELEIW